MINYRNIFTLMFLLNFSTSYGQLKPSVATKEETFAWIKQKLEGEYGNFTYEYKESSYSFKINFTSECNCEISYRNKKILYSNEYLHKVYTDDNDDNDVCNEEGGVYIMFNISSLTNVGITNDNQRLAFSMRGKDGILQHNWKTRYCDNNKNKENISYFSFYLLNKNDMHTRMINAFNNLIKVCPQKNLNEKF